PPQADESRPRLQQRYECRVPAIWGQAPETGAPSSLHHPSQYGGQPMALSANRRAFRYCDLRDPVPPAGPRRGRRERAAAAIPDWPADILASLYLTRTRLYAPIRRHLRQTLLSSKESRKTAEHF